MWSFDSLNRQFGLFAWGMNGKNPALPCVLCGVYVWILKVRIEYLPTMEAPQLFEGKRRPFISQISAPIAPVIEP